VFPVGGALCAATEESCKRQVASSKGGVGGVVLLACGLGLGTRPLGLGRIWRNAASGVIGWLRRGPFGCVTEGPEPGCAVRAVEQGFAQVFERLGVGDALE